jgi:hypothetical protein
MKKSIFKISAVICISTALFSCQKQSEKISTPQQPLDVTTVKQTRVVGHLALERFTTIGQRIYRFASVGGTANYGLVATGVLRNQSTTAPLLNVTGLATTPASGAGFCLSRPTNTSDWEIWKFPVTNPALANLTTTIPGSAAFILSDLEWDFNGGNRFIALNRTSQRVVFIPLAGAFSPFTSATASYSPLMTNVTGLTLVGGAEFLLGTDAAGVTGHLMKCNLGIPGWTLANATFTPPLIPGSALQGDAGILFDPTINQFIVGGAQGTASPHWTLTRPAAMGSVPPVWLQSFNGSGRIFFLDFAPL